MLENKQTNCAPAAARHGSVCAGASSRPVAAAGLPGCMDGTPRPTAAAARFARLLLRHRRHPIGGDAKPRPVRLGGAGDAEPARRVGDGDRAYTQRKPRRNQARPHPLFAVRLRKGLPSAGNRAAVAVARTPQHARPAAKPPPPRLAGVLLRWQLRCSRSVCHHRVPVPPAPPPPTHSLFSAVNMQISFVGKRLKMVEHEAWTSAIVA